MHAASTNQIAYILHFNGKNVLYQIETCDLMYFVIVKHTHSAYFSKRNHVFVKLATLFATSPEINHYKNNLIFSMYAPIKGNPMFESSLDSSDVAIYAT